MKKPTPALLKHKIDGPPNEVTGAYAIRHYKIKDYYFQIIASDGLGWEHVSVTLREVGKGKFVQRCPTWGEMCYIKSLFWNDDETAMQLHPPKSEHVNNHAFCLHLWRPLEAEIPMPDKLMVGV